MKTNKSSSITLLVLFFLFTNNLFSQNEPVNELLKEAKSVSDTAYIYYNRNTMQKAHDMFDQVYQTDKSNIYALYYLTYTEYKLLEMSMQKGNWDEELFDKYYEPALSKAEKLAAEKNFESEGKTILAAIYMMKIANSAMSAVTLSPKINGLLNEAERSNASNPRLYIIRGQMKYNTPGIFGGSYKDAAQNFRKTVWLFEKEEQKDYLQPSWGYLESLAWLGRALEKLENFDEAKFIYQKALNVAPNFSWVKFGLLPKLEQKLKEKN
ncbi:MAG: tetratricopeptide repeat protein [Bacteroidetes bacterium]|nr:tetratricopeptide repeat protein [Bacteroidota bacterium]MBU1422539.1 tetratricopeptide repeat protein [Bacteroidota bacterium]MBU2635672.1 tetratricopeptide repeat protein [Bacteroidota bacterium]